MFAGTKPVVEAAGRLTSCPFRVLNWDDVTVEGPAITKVWKSRRSCKTFCLISQESVFCNVKIASFGGGVGESRLAFREVGKPATQVPDSLDHAAVEQVVYAHAHGHVPGRCCLRTGRQ